MNIEKQEQAKDLYFQTDLTKTQIAEMLGIPRRTLHYWIRSKNWNRLKECSTHMPALIAENIYHILARFSEQILYENRIMRPVTRNEADTLYKLALTVNKLKNRSTVNESMEMFGHFLEKVKEKCPDLTGRLTPLMEDYMAERVSITTADLRPDNFNNMGLIPQPEYDYREDQLDYADYGAWKHGDDDDPNTEPLDEVPLGI